MHHNNRMTSEDLEILLLCPMIHLNDYILQANCEVTFSVNYLDKIKSTTFNHRVTDLKIGVKHICTNLTPRIWRNISQVAIFTTGFHPFTPESKTKDEQAKALDTIHHFKTVSSMKKFDRIELVVNTLKDKLFLQNCEVDAETTSLELYLASSISNFLKKNVCEHLQLLNFGIACMQTFVQLNWIGPVSLETTSDVIDALKQIWKNGETLEVSAFNSLRNGCEPVHSCVVSSQFLLLAKCIFQSCELEPQSKHWWNLRALSIYQSLLEDPCPEIRDQILSLAETIQDQLKTADIFTRVLFDLEMARIHLQLYSDVVTAQNSINRVLSNLKLTTNLHGALGKRTRFQNRTIPQLTLQVISEKLLDESNRKSSFDHLADLPKDIKLDDEVRLPQIQFDDHIDQPDLTALEQATILSLFVLGYKNKPSDELQIEELSPYLTCILSQPKVWSIQTAALYYRSRLESSSTRTTERSLTQMQSLLTDVECLQNGNAANGRQYLFFASYLVPKWRIEKDVASLLVGMGAIQSALDIYLRLRSWEDIVACYNYLELKHKAAEVIRAEMVKEETPKLLCFLGDATDDVECYNRAWKLSGEKSSRAQKHLALYYFKRKMYKESIPYFEKSLEMNSLQINLWFNLGYAALREQQWDTCAKAYRRYCALEPDCFEAWNNLSNAYIRLGQKDRAFRTLQEAIKCNYDNWKVWDNLMAVSVDCGFFGEAINCFQRILDLKDKHVDLEVLKILVKGVSSNSIQIENEELAKLKIKLLKLFGRITSKVMNNAEIWELYADITSAADEQNDDAKSKVAQYLQKAHRVTTLDLNWSKTVEGSQRAIALSLRLVRACNNLPSHLAPQQLNSSRLMLKNVMTKIKMDYTDIITGELKDCIANDWKILDGELKKLDL